MQDFQQTFCPYCSCALVVHKEQNMVLVNDYTKAYKAVCPGCGKILYVAKDGSAVFIDNARNRAKPLEQ